MQELVMCSLTYCDNFFRQLRERAKAQILLGIQGTGSGLEVRLPSRYTIHPGDAIGSRRSWSVMRVRVPPGVATVFVFSFYIVFCNLSAEGDVLEFELFLFTPPVKAACFFVELFEL